MVWTCEVDNPNLYYTCHSHQRREAQPDQYVLFTLQGAIAGDPVPGPADRHEGCCISG